MVTKEDALINLTNVLDPEVCIDIVNLGLVYDLEILNDGKLIKALISFTTPGCPAGDYIYKEVEAWLKRLDGVEDVEVNVTFEPAWEPEMMSPEAKAVLNM